MKEQSFSNHSRYVPLYHFVAYSLVLFALVWTLVEFFSGGYSVKEIISGLAGVSLVAAVGLALWFARAFALRAQDRAIRAEENLRHFIATGKPLDSRLRMRQIVALRFAGDEEFVALARKAAEEKMSARQIKESIQHWRPDYNRA